MEPIMRTLASILLALAVIPAADAQITGGKKRDDLLGTIDYKACEANPRWLLVTVVEQKGWTQQDDGEFKPSEVFSYRGEVRELIDRCEISSIGESGSLSANSRARIIKSSPGALIHVYVKESLTDICGVLPDCADASVREDRP